MMKVLQMDPSYAERDLNVGFSGGEKKKAEILQMLMLKPSFAILDETDSGLDVDAVRTVSSGVEEYQKSIHGGLLIITHSTRILESLHVDATHCLLYTSEICQKCPLPVYAIGGMNLQRLPLVIDAGAAGCCMMSRCV